MAEVRRDGDGQVLGVYGEDRSGSGVRSRLATAAAGTTAGKGLGSLGSGGSDMPRQNSGESAADYGERLRAYREKKRGQKDTAAQKDAIRSLP